MVDNNAGIGNEIRFEMKYDDDRAKEWIYRAITGLTPLEQKVLALFYSLEMTVSEISERVNLSPAGVRNTLSGARNTIRLQLRRKESETRIFLPDTIPASALSTVIGERMRPLLMEIEHDEEARRQAERIRLEEMKRAEEQKLREEAEQLEAQRKALEAARIPDAEEPAPEPEEPAQQFVIYGSPYEQDRRRAAIGALAAGTELPEEKPASHTEPYPIPSVFTEERDMPGEAPADDRSGSGGQGGSGRESGSGRSGSKLWIVLLAILLVLLLALGVLVIKLLSGRDVPSGEADPAGGEASGEEVPGGGTSGEEGSGETVSVRAEAAKAYLALLDDKESSVNGAAQYDGSFDNRTSRPAALFDLDGDGIEELFLLTTPGRGLEGCELRVYGFRDGKAKEISYGFRGKDIFDHYEVAGGGNFAVYAGKEPGTLYIYHCMVDDGIDYELVKYRYDGGGELEEVVELTNWYWNHGDPATAVDEYKENGEVISASEGGDKFSAAFADCGTAILFSTAKGTDEVSLWKYFDTDKAEAASVEDIRTKLENFD